MGREPPPRVRATAQYYVLAVEGQAPHVHLRPAAEPKLAEPLDESTVRIPTALLTITARHRARPILFAKLRWLVLPAAALAPTVHAARYHRPRFTRKHGEFYRRSGGLAEQILFCKQGYSLEQAGRQSHVARHNG